MDLGDVQWVAVGAGLVALLALIAGSGGACRMDGPRVLRLQQLSWQSL